jgi:hypothetical protein
MLAEPKVVQRADQPYVAIRALVTMEALGAVVPPLNREVFGWLGARGGVATGAPFWKYNVIDMERQLEVEAGTAVAVAMPGDDRVLAGVLPGGRYATVRYTGHPAGLAYATAALLDWGARAGADLGCQGNRGWRPVGGAARDLRERPGRGAGHGQVGHRACVPAGGIGAWIPSASVRKLS